MQARGPLMVEHRLIEKMIGVIAKEINLSRRMNVIDPYFIDTAVDFIRIYADRTHHGKEEEIMFCDLARLPLSAADAAVMDELVAEHVKGRQTTRALVEATKRYRQGDDAAFDEILTLLQTLVDFYPKHIYKEDQVFFPAVRAYLSDAQEQAMLAEFWEFDRRMIHDKYKQVVQEALAAVQVPA